MRGWWVRQAVKWSIANFPQYQLSTSLSSTGFSTELWLTSSVEVDRWSNPLPSHHCFFRLIIVFQTTYDGCRYSPVLFDPTTWTGRILEAIPQYLHTTWGDYHCVKTRGRGPHRVTFNQADETLTAFQQRRCHNHQLLWARQDNAERPRNDHHCLALRRFEVAVSDNIKACSLSHFGNDILTNFQ